MTAPAEEPPAAHLVVLRVRLEDGLPIGHAIAPGHGEQSFEGWLGLMGAVQTLLADEGATDADRAGGQEDPGNPGSD